MKKVSLVGVICLGMLLMAGGAFAASTDQPLTINATVSSTAKLAINPVAINFPNADPDSGAIPADNPVTVTAKVKTGSSSKPTLTLLAGGPSLVSGGDNIPISNITWTAASPFTGGTMNNSLAQPVDNTWTGSGVRGPGNLTFSLANSWNYATGTYSQTSTFTLTAP